MQNNKVQVSIVAPFYNEEETAKEFCDRVTATLLNDGINSFEIIAVNDGSTDNTGNILVSISKDNPALRYFELSINRGQTIALYAGIQQSCGDKVIIMDSDLQHLPEEIPLFIKEMDNGYDMVSGRRVGRKESIIFRRIPSLIANFIIRKLTGSKVGDQGGFKCLRGELARKMMLRPGYHRFIPVLVQHMGGCIGEVPISAPQRQLGKSKYGISRMFDVMLDILMLWFESSGKTRPLYFLGKIGLFMFFLATFIFLWLVVEKIWLGYPVASRPPFYLSILLYIVSVLTFYHALTLEILSNNFRKISDNYSFVIKKAS